jgi:aspartate ammonia-lyase
MRLEKDSIGEKEIPDDVYYGIQTLRAVENFPVSGRHERPELIKAYMLIKKAAAITNMELGTLDNVHGKAIVKAADEIIRGKLTDQFPLDIFQAGAGTSFNMNINEVLANRALEILGKKRGEYDYLSPNDHVNQSQSSNDTFPTASHVAILFEADILNIVLLNLASAFKQKGKETSSIPKSGRTHLMDAVPVTIGDEFIAYGSAIKRAAERIRERRNDLLEVAVGGTATGTGVNSPLFYREKVVKKLAELTSLELIPANDSFEALQSRSQMAAFSGSLRELALELIRIANDLRLMGSGPTSGLNEIVLPPVQPGSSIMPGKVSPVMAECLNMVAYQVVGCDTAVSMATQAGQLELNVMTPAIAYNMLFSIQILSNYIPAFTEKCIRGITVDEKRCEQYLEKNPSLATLLAPKIGYLEAAKIAKQAQVQNRTVKEVALEKGLLTKEEVEKVFSRKNLLNEQ